MPPKNILDKKVLNKTVKEWIAETPIIESIMKMEEVMWLNNAVLPYKVL